MTLAEFKAWFDGYTEGMDSTPNAKQWERIKARVKEINGTAVTREVYYRDYWRGLPWVTYNTCLSDGATAGSTTLTLGASGNTALASYNSTDAMYALGKAEAA